MLSETNLKKLYKQLRVENIKLKQALELTNTENAKKDKLIMELNTANMEIREEMRSLNAMLKVYDNSNTPSSKQLPASKKKGSQNGVGSGRDGGTKRRHGEQAGHTGKTCRPKPT